MKKLLVSVLVVGLAGLAQAAMVPSKAKMPSSSRVSPNIPRWATEAGPSSPLFLQMGEWHKPGIVKAGYWEDVIASVRSAVSQAIPYFRSGARNVRDWMNRIVNWLTSFGFHLESSGSNDEVCQSRLVRVWWIRVVVVDCTVRKNGSYNFNVYTR